MAARLEMVVSSRARNRLAKRYEDFFFNLKAAMSEHEHEHDQDHAKSFHFLNHARSIAMELISKCEAVGSGS